MPFRQWIDELRSRSRKRFDRVEVPSHLPPVQGKPYPKVLMSVGITSIAGNEPGRVLSVAYTHGNVSDLELEYISRIARSHSPATIFEIGTFNGRTTLHLAANTPPATRIVTLDLPERSALHWFFRTEPGEYNNNYKGGCGALFRETPYSIRITQLMGDSTRMDLSSLYNSMDMIFIDGSHAYSYVVSDTELAFKLLRSEGGIMLWHEYGAEEVTKALNEFHQKDPRCAGLVHIEGTTLAFLKVAGGPGSHKKA